ncbi:argininosuccinate lyase [Neolewinella lacunae]|uniref:Argininosuccinate lyase n=1 Tax=Neolewinella lacunae TaxID=1517758 RepID=A0A923PRK8_9BACT|nr:argininosuccinate lyase [Neolewinella lacunae]MBC6995452.1 argininosuccinate lyase [Neolewinella lacunae]MDN3635040.1 argininosuccinate lyase [Neolewinella lacunae]
MPTKLWEKDYDLDQRIADFTIGRDREMDLELAPFDILGSLAHVRMLSEVGLIDAGAARRCQEKLKELYQSVQAGDFRIEDGVEDVHSQVELLLTRALGDDGKKIHSGRSRNDQVLVDLRLYFRHRIESIVGKTAELSQTLTGLSDEHRDKLIPGYTHLQIAMVSSFGLWFGAYGEALIDDLRMWRGVYDVVNQNPLGSAAGYGSSFPLNRDRTTELLGFRAPVVNVVAAQMGRGKTELLLAFAIASLAQTLGKMAMDVCLYSSQNFGFLQLPPELTTGSSIMPHKKNPDVFELLRGRCNLLQSLPTQVSQLTTNLPSGYHRDFQLLKEVVFPALDQLEDGLNIALYALPRTRVRAQELPTDPRYTYLYSVEAVNELVLQGLPFRDAYAQVGKDIEAGTFVPPTTLRHTHLGSLGNLGNERISAERQTVLRSFDFATVHAALGALIQ